MATTIRFQNNIFSEEESNFIFYSVPVGLEGAKLIKKIREVSWFVEPFDLKEKKNLLENIKIFDKGDFSIKDIGKEIEKINKKFLVLSNSHLTSYYILKSLKIEKLIVFDAHLDLKDKYKDEKIFGSESLNDATWLRRFSEEFNGEIIVIGARSCDEEELNYAKNRKIKIFEDINEVKLKKKDCYISFDFDIFDPSIFSSTEYPEPGGITYKELEKFLERSKINFSAIDFCFMNFSEKIKTSECFLIVKTIFKFLSKNF